MSKFSKALDNFFKISEKGSNLKTEIVAGVTTFMAMVYILIVNPNMISALPGTSFGGLYIATALGAIFGTLMMAFVAKIPFAQASGMGLNAYFTFSVCFASGLTYANALVIVFFSGILFLLLTVVGIREKIVDAVPEAVRMAIPAGIGLFIAFIGLQSAGILVPNQGTIVGLANLNFLKVPSFILLPMCVTFLTFMIIVILSKLKIKGSILIGIFGGTALYYIIGYCGAFFNPANANDVATAAAYFGIATEGVDTKLVIDSIFKVIPVSALAPNWGVMSLNPFTAFSAWWHESFGAMFTKGFSGLGHIGGASTFGSIVKILSIMLAFAMVDMFDTIGTLMGTAERADMLDENGKLPGIKKALFSDAAATVFGAVVGTSTVTTYVESSAGVAEGGRTGFASLVTGILFIIAMFLSPIAYLIPGCATAAALLYVGVLMMGCVTKINFNDLSIAVPAFLTILMMPLTY
ncbi:MAG: NCS2 family permease, partial [Clostridia bacterium]